MQDLEFNKFMVKRFTSVCRVVELACDVAPVKYTEATKTPKKVFRAPYTLHKWVGHGGMNASWAGDGHLQNLEEQWAGFNSKQGRRYFVDRYNDGEQTYSYAGVGAINYKYSNPITADMLIALHRGTKLHPASTDPGRLAFKALTTK